MKEAQRKVLLRTSDGDEVCHVYIPPFTGKGPDVIIWGVRVFSWYEVGEYREAFAYSVPPGMDDLNETTT